VDVVGHNCPSEKSIALTVEEKQRIRDKHRYVGTLQDTRTAAPIDEAFEPLEAIFIGCRGRKNGFIDMMRKTISQTKCNGLHDSTAVEVRQISSLVPAFVRAFS